MPLSYYSIVQYVPWPTAGERVNVGVVVVDADGATAAANFDDARRRAQRIAPLNTDLSFLNDFQREIESQLSSRGRRRRGPVENPLQLDDLRRLYAEARNVVQFTEPRASAASFETLMLRLADAYLPPLTRRTRARGDRAVRKTVSRAIKAAGLEEFAKSDVILPGRHDKYEFDFAIANGKIVRVVEAKSFDKGNREDVRNELHATAYRFEDLLAGGVGGTPTLVVAATRAPDLVDTAQGILRDIGADLVLEDEASDWAERLAAEAFPNAAAAVAATRR